MKKIFGIFIVLVSVLLFRNNVYAYEEYKIGDLIKYRDEYYFVIADSDENQEYITLLKKDPLTVDEVERYEGGEHPFFGGDNHSYIMAYRECASGIPLKQCNQIWNYDDSYINLVVSNWSRSFKDDLITVDNYKARVITIDELINNLGYEYSDYINDSNILEKRIFKTSDTPWWTDNLKYHYWAISLDKDEDHSIFFPVRNDGIYQGSRTSTIRPVINLDKDAINNCKIKYRVEMETKYANISIGDSFTKKQSFRGIEESDENQSYVTAIRYETLTADEINKYSNGKYNNKNVPYYTSDTCNSNNNISGCTNDYSKSIVKEIVDNWANDIFDDDELVEINGYKARILTENDLYDYLGYDRNWWTLGSLGMGLYVTDDNGYYISEADSSLPGFMHYGKYNGWYESWMMTPVEDSNLDNLYIDDMGNVWNGIIFHQIAGIRPVVNVDKCALGEQYCWDEEKIIVEDECMGDGNTNQSGLVCKEGINYKKEKIYHYNKYKVGDEIEYNGEKYHVIEKSGTGKKYLTILKDKPLTVEELYKYGKDENGELFVNEYLFGEHDPEEIIYEYGDGIGSIAYYTSDECSAINNHGSVYIDDAVNITIGCTNNYNKSDIKKVIDNWSNDVFKNSMIEVAGYKARVLSIDDLTNNLGYVNDITPSSVNYNKTDKTPAWLNSEANWYPYWTMSEYEDSYDEVFTVSGDISSSKVLDFYAVRPVVNVDKCAIDGGCEIEEIQVEDGCIEDKNNSNLKGDSKSNPIVSIIVEVGNTLKNIPLPILIICGILIIGGIVFFGYSFIKSKKELFKVRK